MIFDGRSSTPVVEKHCSRPSGGVGEGGGGGRRLRTKVWPLIWVEQLSCCFRLINSAILLNLIKSESPVLST